MTIQRKYSLPNCTLILEGLSVSTNGATSTDVRPLLSMLVNAECHISTTTTTSKQSLTGGRDFFESLVTAVSGYAQEFLSKVDHSEAHNNESGLVQLQKIDNNRHRLIVQSGTKEQRLEGNGNKPSQETGFPIEVDLTTVQLFDLVEAVDQFFADTQTLPDLSLNLAPAFKRNAGSSQMLLKQAVPAAVGVSSLGLAAIAFFLVPIPEVERTTDPKVQSNSGQSINLLISERRSEQPHASPTLSTQTSSDLKAVEQDVLEITENGVLQVSPWFERKR